MKVLVDARYIDLSRSGVGVYTRELLRGLRSVESGPTVEALRMEGASPGEGPVRRTRISFEAHPRGDLFLRWGLPRMARRHGFNLIHSPGSYLAGPARGIRRVATIHDLAALVRPGDLPGRFRVYTAWELRRALRRADGLVFDTDLVRRQAEELLGPIKAPWVVAGGGVPEGFGPEVSPDRGTDLPEQYLLFVGDPEPRKNLKGLLEAYRNAREIRPDMPPLLLVGRPGSSTDGEEDQGVVRLGYVPRSRLPGLYSGALMLAYPSLYEGFGLPVLEAMASGCPVLTSRGTALEEVAGGAAELVDPTEPSEIAAGLLRLWEDQEHRRRLVQLGMERAASLSWTETARRVIGLWHRLAD